MSATKETIAASDREYWLSQTGHFRRQNRRTVLVVGAMKGSIGEGIARTYGEVGHTVLQLSDPMLSFGDMSDPRNVDHMFDSYSDQGLHPDVLISCVGHTDMSWLELQDPAEIQDVIDSSLVAPMMLTRSFVKRTLREQYLKDIVLIGSMAHRSVLTASAAYCAAKAGLASYVRSAGWELTPKGYRVFGVNPSNTEGAPMTEETIKGIMAYRGLERQAAEDYWGAINLMPRWLRPGDIGKVCTNLTSGSMDWATGTNIDLPGGAR